MTWFDLKLSLQERVKASLKQIGGGSCVTDAEVADVISCVRGRTQRLLLQQPRRGKCQTLCYMKLMCSTRT